MSSISPPTADLPSKYYYFKIVHNFSEDKASFAKVKKALKILKNLVTYKLRQLARKMLLCFPKTAAASSSRNPEKLPRANIGQTPLGSVRVAVKVELNKLLVEFPSATFSGLLAMKRMNISRKTLFYPRSSGETGESNLAEDLLWLRW